MRQITHKQLCVRAKGKNKLQAIFIFTRVIMDFSILIVYNKYLNGIESSVVTSRWVCYLLGSS